MQRRNGTWSFDDHTTSTWMPSQPLGIPAPSREPSANFESSGWDDDEATRPLQTRDLAPPLAAARDFSMDWDEDESTTHTYNPAQHFAPHIVQNSNARAAQATQATRAAETAAPVSPRPQSRKATLPPSAGMLRPASPAQRATAALLRDLESEPARAHRAAPESAPRQARPRVRPSPATLMTRQAELAAAVERLQPTAAESARLRPTRRVAPQASQQQPASSRRIEPRSGPVLKNPQRDPSMSVRGSNYAGADESTRAPRQPPVTRAYGAPEQAPRSRLAQLHPGAMRNPTGPHRPIESAIRNNERAPRGRLQTHTRPVPAHRPAAPRAEVQPIENPEFVYLVDDARWHQPRLHPQAGYVAEPLTTGMPLQYAQPQPLAAELMPNARVRHELPALQHAPIDSLDLELTRGVTRNGTRSLALQSAIPALALFAAVLTARVLLSEPAEVQPAPNAAPTAQPQPSAAAPDAPLSPSAAPSVEHAPPSSAATDPAAMKGARSARGKAKSADRDPASLELAPAEPAAAPAPAVSEPVRTESESEAHPVNQLNPANEDAQSVGMLRLNSRPWSQVTIDGKPAGNTPLMGVRLSVGEHEVEMFNPTMNMRKKLQVRVIADEIVTRIVTLDE